MYFIGVTTGKSSINQVFPKWSAALGLGEANLEGIDFKVHDAPARYREAVAFIKEHPFAMGALVTTHKMDLFNAACDIFDEIDPLSRSMGEISSIYKRGSRLHGRTVDPTNGGKALGRILPGGYWSETGATACILGAGGAGIALTWFLMQPDRDRPAKIVVTDRDAKKLSHMKQFHATLESSAEVEYCHCTSAADNDACIAKLPPRSLLINATGLGKDAPGSPLSDTARFPSNGIAWDLNYRGELVFLDQARAQSDVRAIDGWQYFIYGWTSVIADVFDVRIPDHGPLLENLSKLAAAHRY